MQALVKTHGWERVWNAGMKAVGFPATWIFETANAVKVSEELERQDKEGNS